MFLLPFWRLAGVVQRKETKIYNLHCKSTKYPLGNDYDYEFACVEVVYPLFMLIEKPQKIAEPQFKTCSKLFCFVLIFIFCLASQNKIITIAAAKSETFK